MARRKEAKAELVVPPKKPAGGEGKNKGGRPKFEPTNDQRNLVTMAKGCGLTDPQIASLIMNPDTGKPICDKTLAHVFAEELETGEARVLARVAGTLVGVATDKNHKGCVTAGIFYLKSRAKWREPEPSWMEAKRLEAAAQAKMNEDEVFEVTLILEEPKEPIKNITPAGGEPG